MPDVKKHGGRKPQLELHPTDLAILRLVNGERSQLDIAHILNVPDANYGKHVAVSRRTPGLRKKGYLRDVAERCPTCHGALTRGHKNVPLELTAKGRVALV